jgi:hypothetical protein
MSLKTNPDLLQVITAAGFELYRTCNCRGTYWEKFKNAAGHKLHLAVYKGYFLLIIGPETTRGSIDNEMANLLNTLYEPV